MRKLVFKVSEQVGQKLGNTATEDGYVIYSPLTHHFYMVKLGFIGVYNIFLIFALKHRPMSDLCFGQKY